jgi:DNA-binding transcriptional regulator PaaX
MRFRRNSKPFRLLKHLAIGAGILTLSMVAPASGAIFVKSFLRSYFKKKGFDRHRFLNDLKNLQSRELISYREESNGVVKITLTKNGREKMLRYDIDEMKIKKPAHWDRQWRLVMFDIPHHKRRARDAFRVKLKNLEFYPIQKSVFITPYPCEDEIDFIASVFDVRKNVLILYISHFEGEEKIRNHFKI